MPPHTRRRHQLAGGRVPGPRECPRRSSRTASPPRESDSRARARAAARATRPVRAASAGSAAKRAGSRGETRRDRCACKRGRLRPDPRRDGSGIGAREKYSASPWLSTTTLTTCGFAIVGRHRSIGRPQRRHLHRRIVHAAAAITSRDHAAARSAARRPARSRRCRTTGRRHLGDAIGAGAVRRAASSATMPPNALDRVGDPLVVGRDDHGVDAARVGARGDRRARSSAGRRYRRAALPGSARSA